MGDLEKILIIAGAVVALIILIAILVYVFKYKKAHEGNKANDIKIIDGERYTKDNIEVNEDGSINVSHQTKDIMLERGKEYLVSKLGPILPGKYTILSANDVNGKFNLRLDGFVREYEHQTDVVLTEGVKICSVSHTVILR